MDSPIDPEQEYMYRVSIGLLHTFSTLLSNIKKIKLRFFKFFKKYDIHYEFDQIDN